MTKVVERTNRRIKKKKGLLSDPKEQLAVKEVLRSFQAEAETLERRAACVELPKEAELGKQE